VISSTFEALRSEGRVALIPYVTAGHPDLESTGPLLQELAKSGADIIELGIPFSDPLADGPTIQRSSFASLENGTSVGTVLAGLKAFRATSAVPVVIMTYLNPVLAYGVDRFLTEAADAGAHGLLLTDLPTGADPELEAKVSASPLDLIRLIAPTTAPERLSEVTRGGSGFAYYISRTGVTGARQDLREALADEVQAVRDVVRLPVAVGFGISDPEQAAAVAAVAEGVVVGSALISALDEGGIQAGGVFVRELRDGIDAVQRTFPGR
jgi:tryptophan synthase alpha chain